MTGTGGGGGHGGSSTTTTTSTTGTAGAGGCSSASAGSATLSGNMAFTVASTDAKENTDPSLPRYEWTLDDTTLRCGVDELALPDGTYARVRVVVFVDGSSEPPLGTFTVGNNALPGGGSVDVQLSYEQDNVFTLNGEKQTDNGILSGAGTLTLTQIAAGPTISGSFTVTLGDGSKGASQGTFEAKPCVACMP